MSSHSYVAIKNGNNLRSILVNTGGYYDDIGKNLLENWCDPVKLICLIENGKIKTLKTELSDNIYFSKIFKPFEISFDKILDLKREHCIDLVLIFDDGKWFTFYFNEFGKEKSYIYIPLELAIEINDYINNAFSKLSDEEIMVYVDEKLASFK